MEQKIVALLSVLGLVLAPIAAQTPLEHVLRSAAPPNPVAEKVGSTPIQIAPEILQGVGTVQLFAHLVSGPNSHSAVLFPPPPTAKLFVLDDLRRLCWEHTVKLGPLYARFSLHYDEGAKHFEGSTLFLNSESVNPVGDFKTDWLGVSAIDGLGVFSARAIGPFGIEPVFVPTDRNISTWKLSYTKHIRGANMVPFPFLLSFGDNAYTTRAYSEPDHIRRRGQFFIPAPEFDASDVAAHKRNAEHDWRKFQSDRKARFDPAYLFGDVKQTGQAG